MPASRRAAASTSAAVGRMAAGDGCIARNGSAAAPSPARALTPLFRCPAPRPAAAGRQSGLAHFVGPMHDFEPSVAMLDHGGTALHPVAAIDVTDAEIVANRGVMDVAADHAVGCVVARGVRERALELADIVDGVLDLQLGPLRSRPIG